MGKGISATITVSGIYLIVAAALVILLSLAAMLLPHPAPPRNESLLPLIDLAFACWAIATGVGILMRRNWARYSLTILSSFTLVVGMIVVPVMIAALLLSHRAEGLLIAPIILVLSIASCALIAVPVFFIVFFNLRGPKALFLQRLPAGTPARPAGITLIAIWYLISVAAMAVGVLVKPLMPMPVFGLLLRPPYTIAYLLAAQTVNLLIAVGFLKLRPAAWYLFIAATLIGAAMLCGNLLFMSATRWGEFYRAAGLEVRAEIFQMHMLFNKIMNAVGIVVSLALIWYVWSRKTAFFGLRQSPLPPLDAENRPQNRF